MPVGLELEILRDVSNTSPLENWGKGQGDEQGVLR